MEPLKYYSHVRTTTRSYCLGCNFIIRQDIQSKKEKKSKKLDLFYPLSFIFKEGNLEEISLDLQKAPKVPEVQEV